MKPAYEDILIAVGKETQPSWWDAHGVPRFMPFVPYLTSDIYAREVALIDIACQSCGMRFQVEVTSNVGQPRLSEGLLSTGFLHYGDPPNVGCCAAGGTMNSEGISVLEFWARREVIGAWERVQEWEVPMISE